MKLSILSSSDPLVRDLSLVALGGETTMLAVDLTEDSVVLSLRRVDADAVRTQVPLAHACITCSIREAVVPYLAQLPDARVVLALPPTVELPHAVPQLEEYTVPGEALAGVELTATAHVVELADVARGLLTHVPLEQAGLAMTDDDDRCVGEIHLTNARYADAVVTLGEHRLGAELLDNLCDETTVRIDHLEGLNAAALFSRRHDVDEAIARIHPALAAAPRGAGDGQVWTEDLHSTRPFHPERFRDRLVELVPDGVVVRGCFWTPAHADQVCAVEGSSGSVTVGLAGDWPVAPLTHLVVTGVDASVRERVWRSFHELLMTDAELAHAMGSVRSGDALDEWLA